MTVAALQPGNTKGGVSLYRWPPVWLVWNQLHDNWQFLFLFAKQTNPNQSNRRSTVHWYSPFSIPCCNINYSRKRFYSPCPWSKFLNIFLVKRVGLKWKQKKILKKNKFGFVFCFWNPFRGATTLSIMTLTQVTFGPITLWTNLRYKDWVFNSWCVCVLVYAMQLHSN